MKTFSNHFLTVLVLAGSLVGLAACDSGTTIIPPGPNPLDAVYDTTGTNIFVADVDGSGVAPEVNNVTWTNDFTYVLTNRVFVNDGQTLTIEPGTVIKGNPGLRESATALVVARGGRIMAEGTAADPIVFTSVADNLADPDDEPGAGSWGGVIILGSARTNTTPSELQIEGIPTTEPRARYGGSDDADDSGVFRYVSIRYGGSEIGAGNEINGLTFGSVGSGTTVDHVEVFANQDDGIEFFGGSVNTRYMVVAFVGDDGFDTDQGYRGMGQFWLSIQAADNGENGSEMDGGDADLGGEGSTPFSQPIIWNATYIGSGDASTNSSLGRGINIRDNSAASYYRSYFQGFTRGLAVEDLDGNAADSRQRLENGDMTLRDLLWGAFTNDETEQGTEGVLNEPEDVAPQAFVLDYLNANASRFTGTTSGITSVNAARTSINPTATGPALTNLGAAPTNSFFTNASCIGAVCPGDNWLEGWTALDQLGYLAN